METSSKFMAKRSPETLRMYSHKLRPMVDTKQHSQQPIPNNSKPASAEGLMTRMKRTSSSGKHDDFQEEKLSSAP